MERYLILNLPATILAVGFVAIAVVLAIAGLWTVCKSRELQSFESSNDVAGFIIAVVGALYGVLLAFVVILVWERFDEARSIADSEGEIVLALYRDASAFPDHVHDLRAAIGAYAASAIAHEWPAMATSQEDDSRTDRALASLYRAYRSVPVVDPAQALFLAGDLDDLDDLAEARRGRVFASASQLPGAMWALVLVGAGITVGFTYFFAVPSFRAQSLMVGAMAALIGLTIFLIVSLDYPFSGDLAVEPTALREAVEEFAHLDAAS